MANTIILKRSATPGKVPTTAQLALGEIAINTYDGLLYIKKDDGTPSVVQIGGVTSVNGKTGSAVLSTTDVAEGTSLYFTQVRARNAVSAGTGISYNASTGVISTAQNLSTSGTPSFAGLSIFGDITMSGSIIPTLDIAYDLGSPTAQWKDIYVGPGSLYVNGSKVLQDDSGTIAFTADEDQNIRIKTLGNGILQLGSSSTLLQVDSTLQISSGKNITDSSGIEVNFGDNIKMNNNKIVGLGAPSANTDAATKGYVDTAISGISTSSITQGNSSVAVVDSGTGTVTVTVDGSTALTVDANGVTVAGNFTVSGTQTVVNSNTINLADNIITLNSDHTGAPTQNAGLLVERGDEADTQIRWNEGSDKWTFTNDGAVYYPMATSTDDLAEGSTNLYHTTARARSAISASSASGVSYNSTTGTISLGSIPNSSLANNSITINGTAVALGGTRTLDSDAIGEGSTNLYHTTARARSSVSAGTGISYNSTTGVISTSAIPNASLANSAVTVGTTSISLGSSATTLTGLSSVTSTSFVGALTGNADTATSAGKWTTARTITLAGDLTGSVSIDGSSNVTLTATVAGDSVALGTDTTGNYVASISNGSYITGANGGSEGAALTLAVDATTTNTASKVVARDANGDFAARFITANLLGTASSANSANTANAWSSSRTITLAGDLSGSVSIDGSADATLTATIAANSVALGTDTTGNYMVGVSAGTGISVSHTPGEGSTATISLNASTSNVSEGTNLYYTDARARAALSFTAGSGAYNSSTGVITIPTNNNQLTNGAGYITSSGSISGNAATATQVTNTVSGTTSAELVRGNMGDNDQFRILVGASASNAGYAEIATADDGTEPIYVRQYTGVFTTLARTATLLDGSGNTSFPGSVSAGNGLAVTGNITATGEVTAYFSDVNLKKDIVEIAGALDKVEAIRGVHYRPNETALGLGIEDKAEVGVIAQEIEAVLPELVVASALQGYKTVKYDKLTALLIEAVKELSAKVKTLEAQVGKQA